MNDQGQSIVEYGLILAFVVVVLIIVVTLFGDQLGTFFRNFVNQF